MSCALGLVMLLNVLCKNKKYWVTCITVLPWTVKAEATDELSHDLLIYRSILQDQGRLLRRSSSVFSGSMLSYGLVVSSPINKCILKSEEQITVWFLQVTVNLTAENPALLKGSQECICHRELSITVEILVLPHYNVVYIHACLWHFWSLSILLVSFHLPKWCYHISSILDSKCFQLVTALFHVPGLVSLFCSGTRAPGYWNHTWQPGGWRCISQGSGRKGSLSVNVLNLQMLSKSVDVMYQQVGKFLSAPAGWGWQKLPL